MSLPLLEPSTVSVRTQRPLLDVTEQELRTWLRERDQPPLRARQARRWLLGWGAESFEQMTDLPRMLRQELASAFVPLGTEVVRHLVAADATHKLLLRLRDGKLIESVLIQDANRRTACMSTQVGCGMGCVFCASGLDGVERNLTAAEMIEQLIRLRNLPGPPAEGGAEETRPSANHRRLTHLVVMGMGEPLANLDNLLEALEVATSKEGLGIGARHITISTVGVPVKMRRLAERKKQYHLAVSLHAPNDALRSRIVATHPKEGIAAILEAADYFHAQTKRQVTFEYVLLGGLNDRHEQARELAALLRGRQAHVNLIPFNDVEGLPYRRPTQEALTQFLETLRQDGLHVKVRKRKGSEIDAACGQLRRQAALG